MLPGPGTPFRLFFNFGTFGTILGDGRVQGGVPSIFAFNYLIAELLDRRNGMMFNAAYSLSII